MAVIGKIRNRLGGLLIVVVGGAIALFIMDDLLGNRGQFGRNERSIGTIAGEPVDQVGFERRVSTEADALRNDFGQPVDNNSMDQLRNGTWNEIVRERLLKRRADDAGFGTGLSKEEFDDIRFGANISPDFRSQPAFQNPATGQVDPEKVRQWFVNVQQGSPTYYRIQNQRMVESRLYTKYNTLVKKSVFANSVQARDEIAQRSTKVSFEFVVKSFASEPDSLYPVSDADLKRYYSEHKNDRKHKQTASRSFDYVTFTVTASEEDRAALRKDIEGLRADFAAAMNDSLFVLANSDTRSYTVFPYAEGTADQVTDQAILNGSVGEVYGPYQEGDVLRLVKIKELASIPEARVRHILLMSNAENDTEKKKRADSLLTVVKKDRSKFEDMVTKFSEDPGSVNSGGVYEWFDKNRMVPEFTKASFEEKVGAITVCKTTYGYHIVEVLGQRERQERRLCAVDRRVKPSPATFNAVYKRANEFSLDNNSLEKFKAGAEAAGLEVRPADDVRLDQRFVPGISQPATILAWVNNAEMGQVSGPLQSGDSYIVAALRRIKKEGAPELEDVREAFTREVVKQKKAEAFKKQMAGQSDLNALAAAMNLSVQTANDMALNSNNIPGAFSEVELIGRIFALPQGQMSQPMAGENGVYVVRVTSTTPAEDFSLADAERKTLTDRVQGRAEGALFNALRERDGVVDERARFY
ncbi:MAG: peptidylprolyl isomerase [Flavobacteriales bacterium]|nr:peptidylprolyl isomerase [Flavobacteriales bacterium]